MATSVPHHEGRPRDHGTSHTASVSRGPPDRRHRRTIGPKGWAAAFTGAGGMGSVVGIGGAAPRGGSARAGPLRSIFDDSRRGRS